MKFTSFGGTVVFDNSESVFFFDVRSKNKRLDVFSFDRREDERASPFYSLSHSVLSRKPMPVTLGAPSGDFTIGKLYSGPTRFAFT